jgi:hypothetical protein
MGKLHLFYGTVKTATGGRHFMAWARSRDDALNMVESALTSDEPVLGSVVGPVTSLPDDVMRPGVFVEAALKGPYRPRRRGLARFLSYLTQASKDLKNAARVR